LKSSAALIKWITSSEKPTDEKNVTEIRKQGCMLLL